MPIYEYECIKCEGKFELRRSVADSDSEVECPKCGAENPRRVFSVFAVSPSSTTCASDAPT